MIKGLLAAVAVTALGAFATATGANAQAGIRGGGFHGGGMGFHGGGGFRGGGMGFHGGGFRAAPMMGYRGGFGGPGFRGGYRPAVAGFPGPGYRGGYGPGWGPRPIYRGGYYRAGWGPRYYGGYRRGYGPWAYGAPLAALAIAAGSTYGYYGYGSPYYSDGCVRPRQIWTPYGWRIRYVNVCY